MKIFPDHTGRALVALAALEPEFVASTLSRWRAKSKLFARINPPGMLSDGESYQVDVAAARFSVLYKGEESAAGPLQVIGTEHDGRWVWGWENPSVAAAAKQPLAAQIAADSAFAELRQCVMFEADDGVCDRLASFAANRAGWLGAYPAPFGDGTIVHLALKLTRSPDHSVEPKDNMWCSWCGAYPEQVERMLRADDDCAICSNCVGRFAEIMNESPLSDAAEYASPCLLCGQYRPRVMSEWGAACKTCIDNCVELLA